MRLVRVIADFLEGRHESPGNGLRLLCGIDDDHRIVPGEWFGCAVEKGELLPFILKDGRQSADTLSYGSVTESTTLGARSIEPGGLFAVSSADGESWTYRIRSVHVLATDRT